MSTGAVGEGRPTVAVIGIGNEFRGDDGVGPMASRLLAAAVPPDVRVREETGEATRVIEAWDGAPAALVIDAVVTGATPGTLHRWVVGVDELPSATAQASTHASGLAEAIALAAALDRLPPVMVVHGVEIGAVSDGPGLTPPVAASIDGLLARVQADVASVRRDGPGAVGGRIHVPG